MKNFKKTITCTLRRPRLKTIQTHSWMRTHILLGLNIMEEATKRREDLKQLWIQWRKFSKDSKSKGILSLGSRCFNYKQTLILQRLKALRFIRYKTVSSTIKIRRVMKKTQFNQVTVKYQKNHSLRLEIVLPEKNYQHWSLTSNLLWKELISIIMAHKKKKIWIYNKF